MRLAYVGLMAVVTGSLVGSVFGASSSEEITRLRDLHLDTVLVAAGRPHAAIVAPADGRYAEAVAVIQQAIKQAGGVELPVIADTAGAPEALLKDRSLIAVGNMATSKFMFELYRLWYSLVDLRYPGNNGYVLRSLHDPFATGHNVLIIGGSDDAGVLLGAGRFAELLKPGDPLAVGWLMQTKLGDDVPPPPATGSEARAWDDSYREDENGKKMAGRQPTKFSGWNPMTIAATLYYMTGEERYLRELLSLAMPDADDLPAEIRTLYIEHVQEGQTFDITHPIALTHHYTSHRFPLIWNLIEPSPLLTDEQRLRITNDLRQHHDLMLHYGPGQSRHGTYVALTMHTEARYFDKYYPDPQWKQSLERARGTFMWWTRHSSWGESDQMEWINTCIHPVAHYFMMTDAQPWIDSGIAKVMLDTLLVIWSGRPYEPAINSQGLSQMHQAAWLMRDGRYTYAAREAKYNDVFRIGRSWWPTPELDPVPPTDLVGRICIVPLAEPDARDRGVNFDPAIGYQYLTYRSGVGANDSFVMLDGFDGGARNPHHVAAITYLRHGEHELLSGYGNQVTILRDGISDNRVAMAAQVDTSFAGEGSMYVSTIVPDAGYGWHQREMLWVDDGLTLVLDSITAREAGDFEIQCQWEPVRALRASEADPRLAQSRSEPAITLAAAQTVEAINTPGPLQASGASLFGLAASKTIQDDYVFRQSLRADLQPGQRAVLINAVYADAPGQFSHRLDPVAGGSDAVLLTGKTRALIVSAPNQVQDIKIEAQTAYLSSERIVARGLRRFVIAEQPVCSAEQPVDVIWNLRDGALTVQTAKPVKMSLALARAATPLLDGRAIDGSDLALDAGVHRLTGALPGFGEALTSSLAKLSAEPPKIDRDLARRYELPSPDWAPAWQTNVGSAPVLMQLTPSGDELWVSSDLPGAGLHRVGVNGELRRTIALAAPPEALAFASAAGATITLAGGKDNQLRAFDANGDLLWSGESQVWPDFKIGDRWDARWYTFPREITGIRSLLVDEVGGQPRIILGRPSTLEVWSLSGELQQRLPVRWGESGSLARVQRQDGPRILLGHFYCGKDFVYVFDENLQFDATETRSLGYLLPLPQDATDMTAGLQRGVADLRVADLDGDGEQEVIVARGGHWNDLRVYNADGSQCLWLYGFGPAEARVIQELKGRFIRGLTIGASQGEAAQTVAVGLANGWTHCFAADGRHLWSHHFPDIVTAVAHVDGKVAVGLANGVIALLDTRGQITRVAKVDGEITALTASELPLLVVGASTGDLIGLVP